MRPTPQHQSFNVAAEITPPIHVWGRYGFELLLSKTGLISIGAQKVTFKEES